jgi:tripartite-type tricarboxylate transporter receptor subunit TctC
MTRVARSSRALTRRALLATAAAFATLPRGARGQAAAAWPAAKPIRVIVPFGTGGGTDITMRLLGPKLAELLGQAVVIENRPGAGSTTGTNYVAKSPPDGYTLVLATLSSTGVAKGLYANLPYDPVRDLTAIAPTNFIPICHSVTRKGLAVRDTAAWIQTLKANPNKFSYGSSGVGSTGHLASANFLRMTGTAAAHVPYRGGGQVFAALVAGEIQFNSDIPSLMLPYNQSGEVKTLFVATEARVASMPDVPTAAEVGLAGYRAYSWYGIFGPAGVPQPIVERLAQAIDTALADPAINSRLDALGTPAMRGYTPERFVRYVAAEIDTWVPIVKASGATAE